MQFMHIYFASSYNPSSLSENHKRIGIHEKFHSRSQSLCHSLSHAAVVLGLSDPDQLLSREPAHHSDEEPVTSLQRTPGGGYSHGACAVKGETLCYRDQNKKLQRLQDW
jgi:hypothetical protein